MAGTHVLVVEDDPASARLTSVILRRLQCEVQVASTASQAAKLVFGGYRPALVLMDLDLPDLSGMDLAKVFRSLEETRDVPIVAVTASGIAFGEKAALSAGCDGFVRKPLDIDAFPRVVAGYLRPGWRRAGTPAPVATPSLRGRHEAILDALPKAICLVRPSDSTVVYANRRFEQINGATVQAVVSSEMREEIQRQLEATGEGTFDVPKVRADGSWSWVQVTASRLLDDELGDLWLMAFDDITVRKRADQVLQHALARNELRIASLSEAGLLAVMTVDPVGRVLDANDVLLKLLGWSRADVAQGRLSVAALSPPEYHDADAAAALACRQTGHAAPYQKEYLRKDGTRVPVLVSGAALELDAAIIFAVDLSSSRSRSD